MVLTTEEEKQLIVLKNQRKSQKGRLTYFTNQLASNKIVSLCEFQSTLSRVKSIYEKYDNIQSSIEGLSTDDHDDRNEFEDKYGSLEASLLTKIKELELSEAAQSNKNKAEIQQQLQLANANQNVQTIVPIKLPEIKLPKFNGTHMEWLQFRNRFISLIHENDNLDKITKYQYLLSSIEEGKAMILIANLPFTGENYDVAWNLIIDKFDNAIAIQKEHMAQIYDIEKPKDGSHESLDQFINTVIKHIAALKSLKIHTDGWDLFLNHHLLSRLDSASKNEVIKKSSSDKIPTLDEFLKILKDRAKYLKEIKLSNNSNSNSQISVTKDKMGNRNPQFRQFQPKLAHSSKLKRCPFCQCDHLLSECSKFADPHNSPKMRYEFVKSRQVCTNCLDSNHRVVDCSKGACGLCPLRHNILLHFGNSSSSYIPQNQSSKNNQSGNMTNSLPSSNMESKSKSSPENAIVSANSKLESVNHSEVLLATAVIKIKSNNGQETLCRVLLDNGSQSNFISSKLCALLNLNRSSVSIPVSGINESVSLIKHKVTVQIKSRVNDFTRELNCLVLPRITGILPSRPINFDIKSIPSHITLADPSFYTPSDIDMLIGAELYWQIMTGEQLHIIKDLPPFQKSVFGYILSGKVQYSSDSIACFYSNPNISLFCCHLDDINSQIQKFWDIEQIPFANDLSIEEKQCEKHYVEHVKRDESGRYCVALPFKDNINNLGESSNSAFRQFTYLEKKLTNNEHLREQYVSFMQEYLSMNHMELVENPQSLSNKYEKSFYLPHHAVLRESSTTTKCRVVFNASAKTSSGLSLNNCMMVGPTIQQDIFSIVLRFRKYKIAITGDIAKMYRQILVRPEDRDFLRIWWRDNPSENMQCFRLSTVTYGTGCAPFLAIRTLKQLSDDESNKFPAASLVLKRDFYVDDLLTGADSINAAKTLKNNLIDLLKLGGFELRKIESNIAQLADVSEPSSKKESAISILGINWNKEHDLFEISFHKFQYSSSCTKRIVLSEIAQLFDPVGFCAPAVFIAKLFMQSIWMKQELTWDDDLPPNMATEWQEYKQEMLDADKIVVPRCVVNSNNIRSVELHGFGDASEKGFGCAIYIRVIDSSNASDVNLLCAKSRVAPLKKQSIPRLELCASLLLAQLMAKVKTSLEIRVDKTYYWSDSEISILRIKSTPSSFCTFVANRISLIQDLSLPSEWFYVPTKLNPADLVSRGVRPKELKECQLWWKGPEYLQLPIEAFHGKSHKKG